MITFAVHDVNSFILAEKYSGVVQYGFGGIWWGKGGQGKSAAQADSGEGDAEGVGAAAAVRARERVGPVRGSSGLPRSATARLFFLFLRFRSGFLVYFSRLFAIIGAATDAGVARFCASCV